MAAGPGAMGFVYFCGVKLLGYTAAAAYLKRPFHKPEVNAIKIGAARTALGIAAGVAYGGVWLLVYKLVGIPEGRDILYLPLLLPIRIAEWSLVLWFFFDRTYSPRNRIYGYAAAGTAWSYALDFIALAVAWVAPGGFWVC